MKEIADKCGVIVIGSLSKKTDLLICEGSPGSKLHKARDLEKNQTDEWFIAAVSGDLNLEMASITHQRIAATKEIYTFPYKKIPELKGKVINIALLPNSDSK